MGCLNIWSKGIDSNLRPVLISKTTADSQLPECCSHDYFLIYYIAKGYITLRETAECFFMGYGDFCIIPPTFRHSLEIGAPETEVYTCAFSIDFVEQILQSQAGTSGILSNIFNTGEVIRLDAIPAQTRVHLCNLMDFLLYEYKTDLCNAELAIKNCLATVFCVLSELLQTRNGDLEQYDRHSVMYCIRYIKSNYDKPLSLDEMVRLCNMPRKEFCKRFKKTSGYTFHHYLNKIRIEKSLEILKRTEGGFSLHRLSSLCGYENYITFYRNFTRYTGVTPITYVKLNAKETKE